MQVSVETTQGLERRLTITVPSEKVDVAVNDRLKQLAKTQRINGFRPGKVPVSVIKKRYGAAVHQEVAGDVMQRNFIEAIVAEKLNPAGQPAFEPKVYELGKDLEFVATFEIYPEVAVANFENIAVEKPEVSVAAADLKEMIETLRKQHATWKETKAKIKSGDKVTIDFVGTVDGEEFEGGKAEGFTLETGAGRMIPGFEEAIFENKTGDEVTAEVTFPEEYHAENLKGKDAVFQIKITKTERQNLPKVDEDFAKLFGIEDGDVEKLKDEVKKNMERELTQALKANLKAQVLEGLVANNEIEVPKSLVDQEINVLRQQALKQFGGQFDKDNAPELPAEMFEENANRRVKVGLLLGEVIKQNEIKVDDDKVKELIESMASAYEDPKEVIDYYYSNKEMLQNIQNVAIEEQAVELILAKAKVSEVKKSFNDIMNKPAAK